MNKLSESGSRLKITSYIFLAEGGDLGKEVDELVNFDGSVVVSVDFLEELLHAVLRICSL